MSKSQLLSYSLRLPDDAQADALRLLDASRAVINATISALWSHLDAIAESRPGPAWKQVTALPCSTRLSHMGADRGAARRRSLDASCGLRPPASSCLP
jgi:hypothetical protein